MGIKKKLKDVMIDYCDKKLLPTAYKVAVVYGCDLQYKDFLTLFYNTLTEEKE